MENVFLSHIEYALGERCSYKEIENFDQLLEQFGIPNMPQFFGWGSYYKNNATRVSLGIESASKTLSASQINPDEVDLILFCATNFDSFDRRCEDIYGLILKQLGTSKANIIGITLNNCTNLMSAVKIGNALILADRYRKVLVISSDKVDDEKYRLNESSIFSDAAVSFILSSEINVGYKIIVEKFSTEQDLISNKSLEGDVKQYTKLYESVLGQEELTSCDIEKLFVNNLYLPMLNVKEEICGFSSDQIYTDNVHQKSHCFSADAFINLKDYESAGNCVNGTKFILSSNSIGLRAVLLLERYFA